MTDITGGDDEVARAENKKKRDEVQEIVGDIWGRARINAFAHKISQARYRWRSTILTILDMLFSLLAIFSVIVVFLSTSEQAKNIFAPETIHYIFLLATVLSIVFNLLSSFVTQFSNYKSYDVAASEHFWLLGAYQHIAQKARAVRWPDMDYDEMSYTLRSIEEEFQLLKARGLEPSHRDFEKAHKIMNGIRKNKEVSKFQSFFRWRKSHGDVEDDGEFDSGSSNEMGGTSTRKSVGDASITRP